MHVIAPRAVFTNATDSTYFAIPRYRLIRLLRDAQLSDSLTAAWQADIEQKYKEIEAAERSLAFWRPVAIAGIAAVTVLLIGDVVRR